MSASNPETGRKSKDSKARGGVRGGPSPAQRAYLKRGLDQPGGKLPLFDPQGREVGHDTVRICLERGWAEPWFANPIKPDWMVARLTAAGRALFADDPPSPDDD